MQVNVEDQLCTAECPGGDPDGSPASGAPGRLWLCLVLCAAALVAGVAWVGTNHGIVAEEPRVGASIAVGNGFSNALADLPGVYPTSWCPPGYPVLVAAVFSVFGVNTEAAFHCLTAINVLAFVGSVGLLFRLTRLISGSPGIAVIAATLVIINPQCPRLVTLLWDDLIALFFFLLICNWVLTDQKGIAPRRTVQSLSLGILCGILLLFKASYLMAVPVILVIACIRHMEHWRFQGLAVAIIALSFCLLPWVARNYLRFGQFIPIRGGLGLELLIGNSPGASGTSDMSQHPGISPTEHRLYVELGETKYFEHCMTRFRGLCAENPARLFKLSLDRTWMLWWGVDNGRTFSALRVIIERAIALFAVVGFIWACVSKESDRRLLLCIMVGWAAVVPYVVTHVNYTYATPLRFLMSVLGAFGIVKSLESLRRSPAAISGN